MKTLAVRHTREAFPDTSIPDIHQDAYSRTVLGFWMYLMTDCLLFVTLFATYAVLHDNTYGGPTSQQIFSLSESFIETMILLLSSLSCGLGLLCALKNQSRQLIGWFFVTFLLGASFVGMEIREFAHLVQEGNSWERSAFLSSFFTLVGTHGFHVSIGLLWMIIMMLQVFFMGITTTTFRRVVVFNMFWHFLDLVWIFIFTFVYLMGVI
jgi:cytochrome o ubiquinol oxidase subunit III